MTTEPTDEGENGVAVVEFDLSDPTYPFVGVSQEESCRVKLEKMLPRGSGSYGEFFSIRGTDPERVLDLAEADDMVEPNLIARYPDGGLFEFVVEGFCPARNLAERGAVPRELTAEEGEGKIVAEIPARKDAPSVIAGFLEEHPAAELVAKRTKDQLTPTFTREELQKAVGERLTPREQEVLQTAFESGYYDTASSTTGEQLAKELDISPGTVYHHLREAERKLVTVLLEDEGAGE